MSQIQVQEIEGTVVHRGNRYKPKFNRNGQEEEAQFVMRKIIMEFHDEYNGQTRLVHLPFVAYGAQTRVFDDIREGQIIKMRYVMNGKIWSNNAGIDKNGGIPGCSLDLKAISCEVVGGTDSETRYDSQVPVNEDYNPISDYDGDDGSLPF